jgi:Protein of unknown function (DUF2796)
VRPERTELFVIIQVTVMNTRSAALMVFCPVFLSCLSASAAVHTNAHADEFEERAAHEHGKVTINVALEETQLVIELDSPAVNIVGFEHEPRTDGERAAVRKASDILKSGKGLFGLSKDALCMFEGADIKAPKWEQSREEQGAHDEHEHHADYEARFTYRCDAPRNLTWLEPWVLDKLLNVVEARVNITTGAGQQSEVVKSGQARVSLR